MTEGGHAGLAFLHLRSVHRRGAVAFASYVLRVKLRPRLLRNGGQAAVRGFLVRDQDFVRQHLSLFGLEFHEDGLLFHLIVTCFHHLQIALGKELLTDHDALPPVHGIVELLYILSARGGLKPLAELISKFKKYRVGLVLIH